MALANNTQLGRKKDIGGLFSSINPAALFVVFTIIYVAIVILGAWLGSYRRAGGIIEPEVSMETAVAAVLGLLAFILGFTFSLTWSRFANRNALVIAHAKAISLVYLRAGLIPENQKLETRKILFEYTTLLQAINSTPELDSSLARLSELHLSLWKQTVSLVSEDVDSELRSLFTGAVNDLIGISMERKVVALFIRIPNPIWFSMLVLALIGMFAFGYQAGMGGVGKMFQLSLLPIAFSLVMVLIADLNSSDAQRHFKVTGQPLQEILEMMRKNVA